MRASDEHFEEILVKAKDRDIQPEFTAKSLRRRERFHDVEAMDDPILDKKKRKKFYSGLHSYDRRLVNGSNRKVQ